MIVLPLRCVAQSLLTGYKCSFLSFHPQIERPTSYQNSTPYFKPSQSSHQIGRSTIFHLNLRCFPSPFLPSYNCTLSTPSSLYLWRSCFLSILMDTPTTWDKQSKIRSCARYNIMNHMSKPSQTSGAEYAFETPRCWIIRDGAPHSKILDHIQYADQYDCTTIGRARMKN